MRAPKIVCYPQAMLKTQQRAETLTRSTHHLNGEECNSLLCKDSNGGQLINVTWTISFCKEATLRFLTSLFGESIIIDIQMDKAMATLLLSN